jgi:hypothetical protein
VRSDGPGLWRDRLESCSTREKTRRANHIAGGDDYDQQPIIDHNPAALCRQRTAAEAVKTNRARRFQRGAPSLPACFRAPHNKRHGHSGSCCDCPGTVRYWCSTNRVMIDSMLDGEIERQEWLIKLSENHHPCID